MIGDEVDEENTAKLNCDTQLKYKVDEADILKRKEIRLDFSHVRLPAAGICLIEEVNIKHIRALDNWKPSIVLEGNDKK